MPNSDTMGNMIRKKINEFSKGENQVKVIESFGMKGYLTCMKYCIFLLGNSSSGFVEAAFFPKWVINLGNRQDGRIITENIINSAVNKELMLMARQLQPTSEGIPIEIYAFSKDKKWENYEFIQADIFDHLLASIQYFDLEIFESPNSKSFKS